MPEITCLGNEQTVPHKQSKARKALKTKEKGALQNALKKHIGQLRKGLADVPFCGRIKLS